MRYLTRIGLSLLWITATLAQVAPTDRAAIDAYRSAAAAVASKPRGRGLEPALAAFHAMERALMQGSSSPIESMTAAQFAEFRAIKGVVASRDEAIFIRPDVTYFRGLARAYGDQADRAFFVALEATYPDSVWPVYVKQQTDLGGCTRFGTLRVTGEYVRWADFLKRHPGRYRDHATKELDAAFDVLTESTCACGERDTVERELEDFLRRVQQPAPRATVEARLQAVRAGRSGMRARCVGGR